MTSQRLQELLKLQDRIHLEIQAERRRIALDGGRIDRPAAAAPQTASRPNSVDEHLAQLGVTAREVKAWAKDAGLINEIKRGRVGAHLVDAYATAHQDHTPIRSAS